MTDPYLALKVAHKAPQEEIRKAFLARAKEAHQDKGGSTEAMTAVNEAWAALRSPGARHDADELLRLSGQWPTTFCSSCGGTGQKLESIKTMRMIQCARCGGSGQ